MPLTKRRLQLNVFDMLCQEKENYNKFEWHKRWWAAKSKPRICIYKNIYLLPLKTTSHLHATSLVTATCVLMMNMCKMDKAFLVSKNYF